MLKIIPNPDREMYETVTKEVEANDGYCCCRLSRDSNARCMCKDFKEQQTEGLCYCERFMKVEVSEDA
jgi:hypothetical protein